MSALTDTAGRLAALRAKLAGRMQGRSPKPGYKHNAQAIRAEIARLEAGHG